VYFKITIKVIDVGIGITVEDQKKLFQPYFKTTDIESQQMNASSHGLGLNICFRISEALKGKISCKSSKGKGTEFKFEFDAEIPVKEERNTG
jgi:signal transduction histidine kinase